MKIATRITLLLLALVMSISFVSCADVDKTGIWENATYVSDKEFGDGATTVYVEVKAEEQSITFTVKTDKTFLGEALLEHELISGEEGAYGLYITAVNGMAIAEGENAYWALYKDGAYSMTGVDTTPIANGEHYELVKEAY
ncbi:MAG: DUF4430 domain-containing protein [Clostridia bacterium]|nr:DUF4430 domain-containing protein [Clostridia bacterium]